MMLDAHTRAKLKGWPGRVIDVRRPANVSWRSHAQISDEGSCYEVRMFVHGVRAEGLSVELREAMLVVTGRTRTDAHSVHSDPAGFERLIGLPADAASGGATARLDAEVLIVRIPKKRESSSARLDVGPSEAPGGGF